MKWIEEGERGEEKKNIEGIKGVEKNLRRDNCVPGSRSPRVGKFGSLGRGGGSTEQEIF